MSVTYHLIVPEDQAVMDKMRVELSTHPDLEFGPGARPIFDQIIDVTPGSNEVTYEAETIGGVSGWWCLPKNVVNKAVILYLHGGAYVLGSAAAYRNFVGQIAARSHVAAFVADYRLAPEHPFPSAMDDASAVYDALSAEGAKKLILMGDSAGGGLALSLLLDAMTKAGELPVAAVVMSPWTDLALAGESMDTRSHADPLLKKASLNHAAELYLGKHDRLDPLVSPLYGNLKGIPPVFIHVGEDEVLLDDSKRFERQVSAAGGTVLLNIWQGMVHVFPSNLALLKASAQALDALAEFVQQQIKG